MLGSRIHQCLKNIKNMSIYNKNKLNWRKIKKEYRKYCLKATCRPERYTYNIEFITVHYYFITLLLKSGIYVDLSISKYPYKRKI